MYFPSIGAVFGTFSSVLVHLLQNFLLMHGLDSVPELMKVNVTGSLSSNTVPVYRQISFLVFPLPLFRILVRECAQTL
jgi:hypothetical protein